MTFRYLFPRTNLIFREGGLENLDKETRKLGKSVLLVTGRKSMQKLGFLDKAKRYLEQEGLKVFHYGKVEPNLVLPFTIWIQRLGKNHRV